MTPCEGDTLCYYQSLNVGTRATSAEIKEGWKAALQARHPDHACDEIGRLSREEDSKIINEAKRVLLNSSLRLEYDRREFVTPEVAQERAGQARRNDEQGARARHDAFQRDFQRDTDAFAARVAATKAARVAAAEAARVAAEAARVAAAEVARVAAAEAARVAAEAARVAAAEAARVAAAQAEQRARVAQAARVAMLREKVLNAVLSSVFLYLVPVLSSRPVVVPFTNYVVNPILTSSVMCSLALMQLCLGVNTQLFDLGTVMKKRLFWSIVGAQLFVIFLSVLLAPFVSFVIALFWSVFVIGIVVGGIWFTGMILSEVGA